MAHFVPQGMQMKTVGVLDGLVHVHNFKIVSSEPANSGLAVARRCPCGEIKAQAV